MKRRAVVPGVRRFGALTVVLAVLLVVGGCSSAPTNPYPGRVNASYGDATSAEAVRGRELMMNSRMLEELADDVTASLKLPHDIDLVGEQCDEVNASWNSTRKRIKICYELVDLGLRLFGDDDAPNSFTEATNATIGVFFH